MKNKVGAPLGNQNARKHGYYSKILDKTDQRNYKQAESAEGLDSEIIFLRAKIISLVETEPGNLRLYTQAVTTLARLLRTRQYLGGNQDEQLRQAVQNSLSRSSLLDFENL